MNNEKKINADQAYSLIKTMVECGATIIVNDGLSSWEVADKGERRESLVVNHIVLGCGEEIYCNADFREENDANGIESAVVVNDCLELQLIDGEKLYIEFYAPKFAIGKIVENNEKAITPMDIFNCFVKSAPVIMTNE